MASPITPWQISPAEMKAVLAIPPLPYRNFFTDHNRHVEEAVRRALSLWVSELEPVIMYSIHDSRPFGITAKGHDTAYIDIAWDDNFYLTGEPTRYPVRRRSEPAHS